MSCCGPTVLFLAYVTSATIATNATVELPFGTVAGNLLSASREFLGVPFAPKPARFTSAQLWNQRYKGGHLEAKSYAAQCMQSFSAISKMPSHAQFSEDCLYLTIYTPREDRDVTGVAVASKEQAWAVMFWIHGGGLFAGSAMLTNYNSSVLAARGRVVVVGANYRLGVLGFATVLSEPGLGSISNQGLRDQRVAMNWVRTHIGAFGGDTERITLFGESAGGDSVGIHVVSAGSGGLFDQAIMQSGGISIGSLISLKDAQHGMSQFAKSINCTDFRDLACLQQVPAPKLLDASLFSQTIGIVIDGDVLRATPVEIVRSGNFNHVPFILGTMQDEANGFLYPPMTNLKPFNASVLECIAKTAFGANASAVLDVFSPVPGNDNMPQLSQLLTHMLFLCPTRKLSMALAKAGAAPWVYSFKRHPKCTFLEEFGFGDLPGAAHGDDVQYVFDNFEWLAMDPNSSFPGGTTCVPAHQDMRLADKVVDLWAGFATHAHVAWPRFVAGDEQALKIDLGTVARLDTETGNGHFECELLESLGIDVSFMSPTLSALAECGDSPFIDQEMVV